MFSANETLLLDGPGVRRAAAPAPRDRTSELTRIVRHALQATGATSSLDRAIRAAAPGYETDADVDCRSHILARRINNLLAQGAVAPMTTNPHHETVRA